MGLYNNSQVKMKLEIGFADFSLICILDTLKSCFLVFSIWIIGDECKEGWLIKY
jgi:hypothetical protein